MSKPGYYVQVSPVIRAEHAEWWGHGGCELMDEIDPFCMSEPDPVEDLIHGPARIGPIDPETMAGWLDRAAEIPGWPHQGVAHPSCPIMIFGGE